MLKRSGRAGKTNGCSRTLVVIGDGDVGSQIREVFDERNKEFSATGGNPVKVIVFRTTTTMERNGLFPVLIFALKLCTFYWGDGETVCSLY